MRPVPTYEYKCAEGHLTEVIQKMSDEPLKKCGTCGKKVERVLFAPSIHYKGTGFYSTDYGKKSDSGDAKKSDSSSSSSSSTSAPKKSDS